VWLKQLVVLPANLAKVASVNKQLELQKELSETQQRLEKAERRLAKDAAIKTGRMFFLNNVFWVKNENDQIEKSPYCPRCFELDGKAIRLITWEQRGYPIAKCPECKTDKIFFAEP
jgi:predicted Zn-ribbon and HTH transcriptional regulator